MIIMNYLRNERFTKHWKNRQNKTIPKACRYGYPDLYASRVYGSYVENVNGKKFLDLTSSIHTCNVGYSHPAIIKAINDQTKSISSYSSGLSETPIKIRLAEKLLELTPKGLRDGKVAFVNSGSDASDAAMQIAVDFTRRKHFLAFKGSWHGWTIGSSSITNSPALVRKHSHLSIQRCSFTPYPYCYRCQFGLTEDNCGQRCVDKLKSVLKTGSGTQKVGACFIEPIQTHGGIVIPPSKFMKRLREICFQENILLIVDEVVTGFGRTGSMWGINHHTISPDIILCGKPMASGLPLGAVIGRTRIMEAWQVGVPSSFAGNPLSCAASLATMQTINKEGLILKSSEKGRLFKSRITEISEKSEIVGDVRGLGLLIGIEIVKDKENKTPNAPGVSRFLKEAFKQQLLLDRAGIYDNVIRISPPLNIADKELERALEIIESCLKKIERG